MFASWWRSLRQAGSHSRQARHRSTTRHQPRVEALEDRYLLAVTLTAAPAVNVGHADRDQSEPWIAIDPTNPARLFTVANGGADGGLFVSTSADGGQNWTSRSLATGRDGFTLACCDGQAKFDQFGNLFMVYEGEFRATPPAPGIFLLVSADGGATFRSLTIDASTGTDQPSLAVGPGDAPGRGSVWVTWRDATNTISARGAPVTGLDQVGALTNADRLDGSAGGNFGDVAVGPNGQVLVTYQRKKTPLASREGPASIFVNVDPDGLGPAKFGAQVTVVDTANVGSFRTVPTQPGRKIDSEPSLAWDVSGANKGRVYLVYTDAADLTTADTNIFLRSSDDDGATWTNPVRVNDDTGAATQMIPGIAVSPTTGLVGVSWYDARNDPMNQRVEFFATVSDDGGATFAPNIRVSSGAFSSLDNPNPNNFGDYTALAFVSNTLYPVWTDNSTTLPGNTDRPSYDIGTARVLVRSGLTDTPRLYVNTPITAALGQALALTIVAQGAAGNTNAAYRGTVRFTSSDAMAGLPADYSFTAADNGRHVFSVTLNTAGDQTITATDTADATLTGTSGRSGVLPPPDPNARAAIAGTVFREQRTDGIREPGEAGLAGRTMFLDSNRNGVLDAGEPSLVTDANGAYRFGNLTPGSYRVRELLVPGEVVEGQNGGVDDVTVEAGADATSQDFGTVILSSVVPLSAPEDVYEFVPPEDPTEPPSAADLVLAPEKSFVSGLYTNLLARAGSDQEYAYWADLLAGGMTRMQVANAVWNSLEHRIVEVTAYYQTLLGRDPDAIGLAFWVSGLQNGLGEVQLVAGFLSSSEFQVSHPDDTSFVRGVYRTVLGRDAEPAGLANWLQTLRTASRSAVVVAIMNSEESLRRTVHGYYNAFLQRDGEASGEQAWLLTLQRGISLQTVGEGFLASTEYFAAATASVAEEER